MAKMMCAKDLLKEKGYVAPTFDTNGFMCEVGDYFKRNSINSKLLLIPYRFADIEWDKLFEDDGKDYDMSSPYNFTRDDEKRGYKAETVADDYWGIVESKHYTEDNRIRQKEAGILVPRIIIDKPFFENAAQTLKVMGGFVLEKKMKRRVKLYWVSLI